VRDTLVLFLLNLDNEYQSAMHKVAVLTAQRRGWKLEVADAGAGRSDRQAEQIRASVNGAGHNQIAALLIHPLLDGMHEAVARQAAKAGIGWVLLNRDATYLDEMRSSYPALPLFCVTPDHHEIGKLQGKAARTLLPGGGNVLCITGPVSATASRQRRAGMEQELAGSGVAVTCGYGDWSVVSGEHAVESWARGLQPGGPIPGLLVAQNDAMAAGASKALALVAAARGLPALARVPVIGCDGVREYGLRLVHERILTATVLVPGTASPAIDALAAWRSTGRTPERRMLQPVSIYPPLETLKPEI
jgi:ABC-type sugar transport system substrate-binding protein